MTDKLEEVENQHYKFQIGMYFSDMKKIKGAILLWSDKIEDPYWNFASKIDINKEEVNDFIKQIVEFYKIKKRKPTIYITPFTKPTNLSELIETFGFELEFTDSWMFYEKDEPKVIMPNNFMIKKVETKEEMKTFVKIFNQSYAGATAEEAYGALPPEYGESLFDSFENEQTENKIIHYLGFLENVPIGVATLIYSEGYGCIYNVGTIPDKRKKGVGSALTFNCVSEAFKNNMKVIFLQTEKGSYNEKYYDKLGFSTKFVGKGFVLKSK